MRKLSTGTWKQRYFYGFTFVIGFFYQPNWFYMNFYSNPKWRDNAWWVPRYEIYSILSGIILCLAVWAFIRFSKRHL